MSQEELQLMELQKKHDHFVERVRRMRYWQIEVDVHRCSGAKDTKKRMEREIDNLLKEDLRVKRSKQKELF